MGQDRDQLQKAESDRGIFRENRRLEVVAADITSTAPPFLVPLNGWLGETGRQVLSLCADV